MSTIVARPISKPTMDKARRMAYRRGFADGLRAYTHRKDGVEYVGTTGKTLSQALEDREQTWNFNPPGPAVFKETGE